MTVVKITSIVLVFIGCVITVLNSFPFSEKLKETGETFATPIFKDKESILSFLHWSRVSSVLITIGVVLSLLY